MPLWENFDTLICLLILSLPLTSIVNSRLYQYVIMSKGLSKCMPIRATHARVYIKNNTMQMLCAMRVF